MTTQPIATPETETVSARAPLILTLSLGEPAQSLFQSLRDRHFPSGRNLVPAHVSLFHALPGEHRSEIIRRLHRLQTDGLAIRPAVTVQAPFPLGRGVGLRLHAPALSSIRGALAKDWADWLTPQDAQGYRPHMTVQNKVDPDAARVLLARLTRGFVPFQTEGVALRLWRYLYGPWESLMSLPLQSQHLY